MTVPFSSALSAAFTFAFIACLIAAGASWLRGGKYHHPDDGGPAGEAPPQPAAGQPATVHQPAGRR
jgi:hypothetical protein